MSPRKLRKAEAGMQKCRNVKSLGVIKKNRDLQAERGMQKHAKMQK